MDALLTPSEYAKLDKYPSILFPLAADKGVDTYLTQRGKLASEYFNVDVTNQFSDEDIRRKIDDTEKSEFVMVPEGNLDYVEYTEENYCKNIKYLSFLLLYPVKCKVKNIPLDPTNEIVKSLHHNFVQVETIGEFAVLKKIDDVGQ